MKNRLFVFLVLICVVTLLPFLGLTDFHTKGEPREAVVAYSMLELACAYDGIAFHGNSGSAVEAKPAEPEDKYTEGANGKVMSRNSF